MVDYFKDLDHMTTNAFIALQKQESGGKINIGARIQIAQLHMKTHKRLHAVEGVLVKLESDYQDIITPR